MRSLALPTLILVALNAVALTEAAWYRATKSITFDETFYLSCGLQTVHDRWIDPRIAGEGVAPLPVLLNYVPPLLFAPRQERPEPWVGEARDRELIEGPRIINALLGGAAVVTIVFVWVYRRCGTLAATFAAGLTALSPSLVAHASLATTDAMFSLFALLALASLIGYLRAPGRWRFGLLAVATAAALTAKYSGVFLLPTIGLMFFLRALRSPECQIPPLLWGEGQGVRGCLTRCFPRISSGLRQRDRRSVPSPLPLSPEERGRDSQSPSQIGHSLNVLWPALRSSVATFAVFLCLMFPLWWGLHLFSFTGPLKNVPIEETPDDSPWVKLLGRGPLATRFMDLAHTTLKRPAPIAGVLFQYLHNEAGHPAYLMGRRSQTGWWYYFPAAFAFKSTPVELLVTLGLIVGLVLAMRNSLRAFRDADVTNQVLLVAIGVFVLMLLTSKIAIGHRYLIVLYPLLAIAAADQLFARLPIHIASLIAACLFCGQAASNAAIAPHFLAYFNAASGGPERGGALLVDSSIDWGQDLPALHEALKHLPQANVAISYFGTADWKAYGVEAEPIGELSLDPGEYDLLAVSVTHLQGVYVPGGDPFEPFRGFKPAARAGYSILVYELNTPAQREAFAEASRQVHAGIAERERIERENREALPPTLR